MKTIWKFKLPFQAGMNLSVGVAGWENSAELELPKGARVLSAGNQKDELFIWALVDQYESLKEKRTFLIQNTGGPFPPNFQNPNLLRFLGTVFFANAALVFHVFEVARGEAPTAPHPAFPSATRMHACDDCGEEYSCTSEAASCPSEKDNTEGMRCPECFFKAYGGCD